MTREDSSNEQVAAAHDGAAVVVHSADVQRARAGHLLDRTLCTLALLALRTRTVRWGVIGPDLWPLRDLLDDQHARLEARVDAIADRMRQLGAFPGGSADAWQELAVAGRWTGDAPEQVLDAIDELVADEDRVLRAIRAAVERAPIDDVATTTLLGAVEHDVACMRWSLRALSDALLGAKVDLALEQVA